MSDSRRMTTYTGRMVDPLRMTPADVAIEDIAHALALTCRYGGHSWGHLSVARHSILVADLLPPDLELAGLLHDAAEAYLGDIPRPLKHGGRTFAAYRRAEARLERVIAIAFDLPHPMPPEVRAADREANAAEVEPLGLRHNFDGAWSTDEAEFLQRYRYAAPVLVRGVPS